MLLSHIIRANIRKLVGEHLLQTNWDSANVCEWQDPGLNWI